MNIDDYLKEQEATPAERWRKPLIPIAVEQDSDEVEWDGNAWRPKVRYTYSEEGIERLRLGYCCLVCKEPQQLPFPDNCSLCGYAMKERQGKDFDTEYQGTKWVGPTTSLSYEFDRMIDEGQRKRHQPGSQILVQRPSGLIVPSDAS